MLQVVGKTAMSVRSYALPKNGDTPVLVVWSTSLEPSDFHRSKVTMGSASFWTSNLDEKFKQGMQETQKWMKRKGLKLQPGHLNFTFLSSGKPWGGRRPDGTLLAKLKDTLEAGRFQIVDRAWQLLDTQTSVYVQPPEEGQSAQSSRGAAVAMYGLPDGLEVSFLTQVTEPEIPTCWERIVEAT